MGQVSWSTGRRQSLNLFMDAIQQALYAACYRNGEYCCLRLLLQDTESLNGHRNMVQCKYGMIRMILMFQARFHIRMHFNLRYFFSRVFRGELVLLCVHATKDII